MPPHLSPAREGMLTVRQVLHEYLRAAEYEREVRRRIQRALTISVEQMLAGDCNPTRNDEMLRQYRDIHDRLQRAAPERGPGSEIKKFKDSLDVTLAIQLACTMNLAMVAMHERVDTCVQMEWFLVLLVHRDDLHAIASLVRHGHPLKPPCYQRDPRATGYFTTIEAFAQLNE